jgi:hypothetical protein
MSLPNFPTVTKNAKSEFRVYNNALIDLAKRLNVHGYVLSQDKYEEMQGVEGAFIPKKQPKLPGSQATALHYTAYNARKLLYDQEQANLASVTKSCIASLDQAHIKMVGHPTTGIINKTILEILTTLRVKYMVMLPSEMTELKNALKNGEHSFNPEDDIDIYLNHIASIHQLAASNHNAFSESDKVEQVSMEMRKLGDPHLNSWLIQHEVTHSSIKSKNFETFSAELRVMYATIRRTTSKAAGYAAQTVHQQLTTEAPVTIEQLQMQLQHAQKQIQVLIGRNEANEVRETQPPQQSAQRNNNKQGAYSNKRSNTQTNTQQSGKKNRPAKIKYYCDTCKENKSHWSNECQTRKDGHNPNNMAP